jgi:hypothetical protein
MHRKANCGAEAARIDRSARSECLRETRDIPRVAQDMRECFVAANSALFPDALSFSLRLIFALIAPLAERGHSPIHCLSSAKCTVIHL